MTESNPDLVRIRNMGSKSLILRSDRGGRGKGDVTINPGQERILPAYYAWLYFGHPGAKNQGRDKLRDLEYKKCRRKWGFYAGIHDENQWESEYMPKFKVSDLDGNRIYTVIEDKDGSLARRHGGFVSTGDSDDVEKSHVDAQIARMQREIDRLSKVLERRGAEERVEGPGIPDDAEPVDRVDGEVNGDADIDGTAQATRNAARDDIPEPPEDEPAVTRDRPKSTRIGGK